MDLATVMGYAIQTESTGTHAMTSRHLHNDAAAEAGD